MNRLPKRVAMNVRMDRTTALQLVRLQESLKLRSVAETLEVVTSLAHFCVTTQRQDNWIEMAQKAMMAFADLSRMERRLGRPATTDPMIAPKRIRITNAEGKRVTLYQLR